MRRFVLGLATVLAFGLMATRAQAQPGTLNDPGLLGGDPFNAYYSWFLPFQLQQAVTPRVEDTVRAYSAVRQQAALTERSGLYDPVGAIGAGYDPMEAFGVAGGRSRRARTTHSGQVNMNINGTGPGGYFNRASSYYPTLRAGRSSGSRNPIAQGMRRSRFSGGGMGGLGGMNMNMGMGMPG
jgi:hypothetical protein